MKRFVHIAFLSCLVCSCYADKSTEATFDYPEIEINPSIAPGVLTYAYGETLTLSAEAFQQGTDENSLEYIWELDLKPGSPDDRVFMGDDRMLEFKVVSTPSSMPYILTLRVSNPETGFFRMLKWSIFVTKSLGEGILVANTRDDGRTYDLDLLATSTVTYGYASDKPRVTEGLISLANGQGLNEEITAVMTRSYTDLSVTPVSSFNLQTVMVGTTSNIYALDPNTYKTVRTNAALFTNSGITSFGCQKMFNGGTSSSFLLMNGTLYCCSDLLDCSYGLIGCPAELKGTVTPESTCCGLEDQSFIYAFCRENGTVYAVHSIFAPQSSLSAMTGDSAPSKEFLLDKTAVAAGTMKDKKACFVVKNGSGSYWAFTVNQTNSSNALVYELDAPDIEKAVDFEFLDNADIFYYSTGESVYATILAGGTATTKQLNWKPAGESERITMVRQYRQAWFGINQFSLDNTSLHQYLFPLEYHRMQLLLITHDDSSGEGRIYLRPFNVSTGMVSVFKDNGVAGGFGRITAVGTTLR